LPVFPERPAVVAKEHNDRLIAQLQAVQLIKHFSNLRITKLMLAK